MCLMKHPPPQVRVRLAGRQGGDLVISAITLAQLEQGVSASGDTRQRNQSALEALIVEVPVVPFHGAAARSDGAVRTASRERTRDALDRLIAAHALSLGVRRVTDNEAGCRSRDGWMIENWVTGH